MFQSNSAQNKVILQWEHGRQRKEGSCCSYKMAQAFTTCYRSKGTKSRYVVPEMVFAFSVLFKSITGSSVGQMWPASHQPTASQLAAFHSTAPSVPQPWLHTSAPLLQWHLPLTLNLHFSNPETPPIFCYYHLNVTGNLYSLDILLTVPGMSTKINCKLWGLFLCF